MKLFNTNTRKPINPETGRTPCTDEPLSWFKVRTRFSTLFRKAKKTNEKLYELEQEVTGLKHEMRIIKSLLANDILLVNPAAIQSAH